MIKRNRNGRLARRQGGLTPGKKTHEEHMSYINSAETVEEKRARVAQTLAHILSN